MGLNRYGSYKPEREYIYIVTATDAEGTHATVTKHARSSAEALSMAGGDYDGYEGPVPLDMYPIGKRFAIADER